MSKDKKKNREVKSGALEKVDKKPKPIDIQSTQKSDNAKKTHTVGKADKFDKTKTTDKITGMSKSKKEQKTDKQSRSAVSVQADGKNPTALPNDITKASLCRNAVIKYVLLIALVGCVSLGGIVMCVLNVLRGNWFFAADYLIASLLGLSIVIIKANTLRPTYVACDDGKILLRTYDNRIVPYNISHKTAFICDFIPAGMIDVQTDIKKVDQIIIGTKKYILNHCGGNKKFVEEIEKAEKSNISKNTLMGTDMIYFGIGDGCEFMSIERFDNESLAAVVRKCIKINPDVQIMCNNKFLRNKILFDLPSK